MKERPILFSGPMVRAILDGRKTQTRRPLRIQPLDVLPMNVPNEWVTLRTRNPEHGDVIRCRLGVPGDRLWLREKWKISSFMENEPIEFQYAADMATSEENDFADCIAYEDWYQREIENASNQLEKMKWPASDDGMFRWDAGKSPLPWRPSIFMPRWASRITLEIVNVRCERVQDIDEKDAIAEGIPAFISTPSKIPRMQFSTLWDSINDKRGFGWDVNPYVWVVEFKRIEP